MIVTTRILKNARQTGRLMRQLVEKYYTDMAPYASLSPVEIFNKIKEIPFNPDPEGVELIKRPYYTINQIGPGGDCDCKSIAIASWAKNAGYPYQFVAVGKRKNGEKKVLLSHVFPRIYINGEWIIMDATYAFNIFGQTRLDYDRMTII